MGRKTERTIKASKFSEAQIAFVLKQSEDGTAIGEVCRKAGISEATFYNWRKRYAGLVPSEMKLAAPARRREEAGSGPVARPRHAAGSPPPKAMKPARRRQLVDHARST